MAEMRALANRGGFSGWSHVIEAYEGIHGSAGVLRIWAGASDIFEIDWICERWHRSRPKKR